MAWQGGKVKTLAKERRLKINTIANKLNVTRQTINSWMNGHVPKGQHLVHLSTLLDVNPKYFFSDDTKKYISVSMHRKKGTAKITPAVKEQAFQLASSYEKLFKMTDPGLVRVLRVGDINKKNAEPNAKGLAKQLRKISGIKNNKPMDYEHVFRLYQKLGIVIIFRSFTKEIKSYAFYCKIHNHRVVFVDNNTNVLDLIFALLHDAVHAILDEKEQIVIDGQNETFCELVANYVQFPPEYIDIVTDAIEGCKKSVQISKVRKFSKDNRHAMYGLVKILKLNYKDFAGADNNFKKKFLTIGEVLFHDKEPKEYINNLTTFTPKLIQMTATQIDNVSNRVIGEWLGLENKLDAVMAIKELKKRVSFVLADVYTV